MIIKAIDGREPHESCGGWANFLKSCELRGSHDGVIWYSKTNCNFFLFPDGTLFENFGYHGKRFMNWIEQEGSSVVLTAILEDRRQIKQTLDNLNRFIGASR